MALGRAPRVLGLCGDETGCSLWRIWQPYEELIRRGFIAEWCHKDASDKVLPLVAAGRYDAIVTPRIVWPVEGVGERWINAIHNAGICWLYECDDDVFSPRIVDRQIKLFTEEAKRGREQLEKDRLGRIKLVQQCDGVTVSTEWLATVVRRYVGDTVPVYVIPNSIDAKWHRSLARGIGRIPECKGKLTIGWAGGAREDIDILAMSEAWSIIAEEYPDVHFVIQGHIIDKLYQSIPKERRHTLPWLQLHEYPRALVNMDIGCAPLGKTSFNWSKSPIKWFEYALWGVASVVSPIVYGNVVTPEVNALTAETTEEWVTQLSRLIESKELRRKLRRNARREVVTKHSLEANWWRWPAAYADAIDRFRAKPRILLPSLPQAS